MSVWNISLNSSQLFGNWAATRGAIGCLWQGDLLEAAELLGESGNKERWPCRWLAAWLSRRLVSNARGHWARNEYALAWAEFTAAEQVTAAGSMDWLLQQKEQLVEEAIATADRLLAGQKSGPARHDARHSVSPGNFLIWVDGVGGYLVCSGSSATAGSFVERPGIEIPLQADLRRRHLRFELHHQQFMAVPLGPVRLNGRRLTQPEVLKDGNSLELTGRVSWRFSQPHPLSSSARIDFCSPHRTVPWSDAILLLADTLIVGPGRGSHIVCPGWSDELILFRRQGQLYVRSDSDLQVDGRLVGKLAPLGLNSSVRTVDGEFSIKLEPVESVELLR